MNEIFPVSGYTLGYVRDLSHGKGIDIGLGTQFTINDRPDLSIATTATVSVTPSIFPAHPSIAAQSRRARPRRANSRNGKITARHGPSVGSDSRYFKDDDLGEAVTA